MLSPFPNLSTTLRVRFRRLVALAFFRKRHNWFHLIFRLGCAFWTSPPFRLVSPWSHDPAWTFVYPSLLRSKTSSLDFQRPHPIFECLSLSQYKACDQLFKVGCWPEGCAVPQIRRLHVRTSWRLTVLWLCWGWYNFGNYVNGQLTQLFLLFGPLQVRPS